MALEAINEQLLRTVRVGVAVFDWNTYELSFSNDAFDAIFEPETRSKMLFEIIPDLPKEKIDGPSKEFHVFSDELRVKKGRRTLVLTITLSAASVGGTPVLVLETHNNTRVRELETMIESYSTMVERNTREIQREKENVEKLLLNIMPRAVYEEYSNFGVVAPQKIENSAILILDFENFPEAVRETSPASLVSELNEMYTSFDQIGQQLGSERIKATGGQYVAIVGIDQFLENALEIATSTATRYISYITKRNNNSEIQWNARIGLGTGMVVGSTVGHQRYVYDVIGPAVDVANYARQFAKPFEILVEETAIASLDGDFLTNPPKDDKAKSAGLIAVSID